MKEFDITITETLEKNVTVEAASREEAEEAVKKAYYNSEYVLDAENFTGVQFKTQAERELQQEQAPTMDVLLVKPGMYPQQVQIGCELEDLQAAVGGSIEAVYPFEDPVAIICNEEGKMNGSELNRCLRDDEGQIYDILAGDFLIAGLTEDDIQPQYMSFNDSTDGLKDGRIDAAFIVAGAPTGAITELCTTNAAYLVPIDGDIAAQLMDSCEFYTAYTIPAGTYEGQSEDVTTVTVKATLIVSADASEEDVYNLTKAIFDNTAAIAAENGKGKELSIDNAISGMSAPFHAGAAKYFAEKGVTVPTA